MNCLCGRGPSAGQHFWIKMASMIQRCGAHSTSRVKWNRTSVGCDSFWAGIQCWQGHEHNVTEFYLGDVWSTCLMLWIVPWPSPVCRSAFPNKYGVHDSAVWGGGGRLDVDIRQSCGILCWDSIQAVSSVLLGILRADLLPKKNDSESFRDWYLFWRW